MRYRLLIILTLLLVQVHAQPLGSISKYLTSPKISTGAKDYYNNKFKASDNGCTFSILDSLETKDPFCRPFYIYLVSRMLDHADGALSEGLGVYCLSFLEKHPNEFIAYLKGLSESRQYAEMDKWAISIGSELIISCEGNIECIDRPYKNAKTKVSKQYAQALKDMYIAIRHYASQ